MLAFIVALPVRRRGLLANVSMVMLLGLWTPSRAVCADPRRARPNPVAESVLRELVSSPLGRTLPALHWQVVISPNRHINAYSDGSGAIYVTGGLAYILANDRGLWAAVLGHEVGHAVIRPEDAAYLPGFERALDRLDRAGGADPPPAASVLRIAVPGGALSSLKLAREREFEADRASLLLMAAAGFHPDYAIAFDRRIQFFLGDHPSYDEFLLGHPRWEEREEANTKTEPVALAIFHARWPDAAQSPGGKAPPLGVIEAVESHADPEGELDLRIPVRFRNAAGAGLRVSVNFLDEGQIVHTGVARYRGPGGMLAVGQFLPDEPAGSAVLTFQIPRAAFGTRHQRLKAVAFLMAGDATLGVYIQPVTLREAGQ